MVARQALSLGDHVFRTKLNQLGPIAEIYDQMTFTSGSCKQYFVYACDLLAAKVLQ